MQLQTWFVPPALVSSALMPSKPVVLIIRDGWGINPDGRARAVENGDATLLSKTPFHDYLYDTSPQSTRAAQGAENAWTKVAAFYRAKAAGAGVDDAQRTTALARAAWADGQADIFTKRLALVIGDPPANAPRTEANAGATTATPRAAQ